MKLIMPMLFTLLLSVSCSTVSKSCCDKKTAECKDGSCDLKKKSPCCEGKDEKKEKNAS